MNIAYEIVQPVRVKAMCGCGGEYRADGRDDLTHQKYGHKCTGCGQEMKADGKFPTIEHFTEAEMTALAKQA